MSKQEGRGNSDSSPLPQGYKHLSLTLLTPCLIHILLPDAPDFQDMMELFTHEVMGSSNYSNELYYLLFASDPCPTSYHLSKLSLISTNASELQSGFT